MQAVLMVAGSSTRTYPLTLTRPKPLLPILNKPLLKHSLDQLVGLFDQIIFITGYRKEMIEELMGNSYRGMDLVYIEQKEQLGTGHAVLQAKPFIFEKFVAMNGDDLFAHIDLEKILQYDYAALAKRVPDPSIYGVFQCDAQNRIKRLVEKPKQFIGDLANIGCYVLQPEFFDELERTPLSERGEIEITSTIQKVSEQTDFFTIPIEGFWLPTGYAWDLLKHQEFLMENLPGEQQINGTVETGAVLTGFVSVGKNTLIKSGAYIEGPVFIGENCQIGPNCYIRGNTSIGNNCRVGNAVEIKNSVIMDNTNIAHLSFVGDSVIGYDCNLGAGTITANLRHDEQEIESQIKGKLVKTGRKKFGAVLSDGVHTGIHTSILPGRKLWPNTRTHPAQVVEKDIEE